MIETNPEDFEKEPSPEVCQHYWRIDPPIDVTSSGVCKKCGEVREFTNTESIPMRKHSVLERPPKPKPEP